MVGLVFNATFNNLIFQLYRDGPFYWWRKPEYPEKTTDLPQVGDKLLSHNVVSNTPRLRGVRLGIGLSYNTPNSSCHLEERRCFRLFHKANNVTCS
jgi:hypothetical protein